MDLPKACLFDLDGVLLDTEPLHSLAWAQTASNFGSILDKDQLNLLKGRTRLDCAKEIIKWTRKPISIEDFLDVHRPIARDLLITAKAMPGAENLVKWCFEKNIPTALVTSSSSSSVKFKAAPHKWLDLIRTRVHGNDPELRKGKPAPDPFLLAAKFLNVNPNHCWAIEDSISGSISATKAGCVVWLLKNNKDEQISLSQGTNNSRKIIINSLDEFLTELKKRSIQ